ncbi:MAG: extracellular solute-binding protein [Bacteroidetes bacterium]|nr:extracellular solute-binding protein [Bacteroidota bacterium]
MTKMGAFIVKPESRRVLTRRGFLSLVCMTCAGGALAACAQPAAAPTATAAKPATTAAPAATTAPAAATTPAPAAATVQPTQAPVQTGAAKPFAGTTINVTVYDFTYSQGLKDYLPEFEAKTGIKVNMEILGWAVYLQRSDLELSMKGSSYDVAGLAFIYTGKWIGGGWLTNLEEYIRNANKTPPDWEPDDFASGAMVPLSDQKGNRHAIAFEAGAMISCAGRGDLIEKAGLKMPGSFDEMMKVLDAINNKEGMRAYVASNTHHWLWMPYLMGFGGNVFKNAPENLTPTLDTPEAIKAAEWYSNVLRNYCPDGVLSYTDQQGMEAVQQGRANIYDHAVSWVVPVGDPNKSKVAKTATFAMMPAGPKGAFPGSNSHGWCIPINSKQKEAGWEFIKWALSKDTVKRVAIEKGHGAPCRVSVINSPEFKKMMTINGQDVAALYLKVLEVSGKGGYMTYRTVPVFPQVGDSINKAISAIASGQMSAEAAMKQAQQSVIADLKKAGVKVDA